MPGEKAGRLKLKKLDNLPTIIQLDELGLFRLLADKWVDGFCSTSLLNQISCRSQVNRSQPESGTA